MGIFYAAVDGDPLTSHEDSHVIAREGYRAATIKGDDGKTRSVVYIGDSAWCGACQSTGVIVGGAGISENRRMIDLAGGASPPGCRWRCDSLQLLDPAVHHCDSRNAMVDH